jgi:regulatory protein YycI of two-component signal transduction system YycFG
VFSLSLFLYISLLLSIALVVSFFNVRQATADYLLANSALSVRAPAGAQAPAAPFPDQNEETE